LCVVLLGLRRSLHNLRRGDCLFVRLLHGYYSAVNPVTVTIGGVDAAVLFAGLAPGFAGLYQLNVVVPGGVSAGDAVPVVVSVAGQASPPVTLAVQ